MAGPNKKQNENIARAKLRQQQQRQRAAKAAAQKRARVTAGVVALLLVVGGGVAATQLLGDDGSSTVEASDDASGATDDLVQDTTPPAPEGKANCVYAEEENEDTGDREVDTPPLVAEAKDPFTVKITTNKGPIELKLDSEAAPCAVNSFVHLAKEGFYEGTECHRILTDPGYGILQCGDPTATGSGGAGYTFRDENLEGATYEKGTVAMANRGANTNGSQFFLVFRDSPFPPRYTPFGTIEKKASFDTLESIAKDGVTESDQGNKDKPKKKVTIEKVSVAGPVESAASSSPKAGDGPGGEPSDAPTSSKDETSKE